MTDKEQTAWDAFAAAALHAFLQNAPTNAPTAGHNDISVTAENAAKAADELIVQRRRRTNP